eukprot:gene33342-12225_t
MMTVSRQFYPDYLHTVDELLPADARRISGLAQEQGSDIRMNKPGMPEPCAGGWGEPHGELQPPRPRPTAPAPPGGGADAAVASVGDALRGVLCQPSVWCVLLGASANGLTLGWGIGGQMVLCWGGGVCATLSGFCFFVAPDLWSLLLPLVMGMVGSFMSASPMLSTIERLVDRNHRGVAMGVKNIAVRVLGAIPGPLLLGAMLRVLGAIPGPLLLGAMLRVLGAIPGPLLLGAMLDAGVPARRAYGTVCVGGFAAATMFHAAEQPPASMIDEPCVPDPATSLSSSRGGGDEPRGE